VVALDDVNYLFYENEASDALYSLLRAHEVNSGARIGVIVVSSDLALEMMDEIDERVRSVFRPEEVFFPKYDREEAFDILRERVERGQTFARADDRRFVAGEPFTPVLLSAEGYDDIFGYVGDHLGRLDVPEHEPEPGSDSGTATGD